MRQFMLISKKTGNGVLRNEVHCNQTQLPFLLFIKLTVI